MKVEDGIMMNERMIAIGGPAHGQLLNASSDEVYVPELEVSSVLDVCPYCPVPVLHLPAHHVYRASRIAKHEVGYEVPFEFWYMRHESQPKDGLTSIQLQMIWDMATEAVLR